MGERRIRVPHHRVVTAPAMPTRPSPTEIAPLTPDGPRDGGSLDCPAVRRFDRRAGRDRRPKLETQGSAGVGVHREPARLLLLGTLLASVLIPRWSAISQDRQPELELKTGLVERVAQSSTETVRDAIQLVRYPPSTEVAAARYRAITKRWLVERAELETVIGTYFPAEVARCGSSSRTGSPITSPSQDRGLPSRGPTYDLKLYLEDERTSCEPLLDVAGYSQQRYNSLKQKVGDFSTLSSADNDGFKDAYGSLGELLLIDRDRIVRTIVSSDAQGFSHGWWIFR